MIRVVLPAHLRTLARIDGEIRLDVAGPVTQRSVLDALEARYPVLRGTIRGHDGGPRRAFIRFFACEQDLSHEPPDALLPRRSPPARALPHRRRHGRRLVLHYDDPVAAELDQVHEPSYRTPARASLPARGRLCH